MNFEDKRQFEKSVCNISDNHNITVLDKELLQELSKLQKKKHKKLNIYHLQTHLK